MQDRARVIRLVLVVVGVGLLCSGDYFSNGGTEGFEVVARRLDSNNGTGCNETSMDAVAQGACEEADEMRGQKPTLSKFLLHLFGLLYMFIALYIVCDEFFVPALDKLSSVLGLSPDVAGATFMAAGGSAPEFFTSLVSAFSETSSDVGIAAIVGSAVFNVLFVIGACGIAAPGTLQLTAYPLSRDCAFYLVDLVVLWWAFADGSIQAYEAAILFALYVAYAIYMKFSGKVEEKLAQMTDTKKAHLEMETWDRNHDGVVTRSEWGDDPKRFDRIDRDHDGVLTLLEIEWEIRSMRNFVKQQENQEEDADNVPVSICPPHCRGQTCDAESSDEDAECSRPLVAESEASKDEDEPGIGAYIWYMLTIPIVFCLWLTVPDVRREGCWKKMYIPAFALSILWIAVFSKFMVDFSETVGAFTGLPNRILAVTLLAWGTSIPDLLTSVLVTWQGHGDMAVSSSIGSNIFDVTVGLPVPWLIAIAVKGTPVTVDADGIARWILTLIAMVFATVAGILINKWVLNKALGGLYIVLFIGFMVMMIGDTMEWW